MAGYYDPLYTSPYEEYVARLRDKGIVSYITDYMSYRRMVMGEERVVALYTTPTCTACMVYKPIFYSVAEEFARKGGEPRFIEVDAYMVPEAAFEVGVMATPTTVFFVRGRRVDAIVGVIDDEELKRMVSELLHKKN
ncbi:MAG: thioredoxin [Hyperthermus sp.]|nr:MAG: thioredoxin [Hyperthermus sp.]